MFCSHHSPLLACQGSPVMQNPVNHMAKQATPSDENIGSGPSRTLICCSVHWLKSVLSVYKAGGIVRVHLNIVALDKKSTQCHLKNQTSRETSPGHPGVDLSSHLDPVTKTTPGLVNSRVRFSFPARITLNIPSFDLYLRDRCEVRELALVRHFQIQRVPESRRRLSDLCSSTEQQIYI